MATTKQKAAAAALATAIAVPCEGIRQWAYYDPPGILSVCEGHTGKDVVKNRKYSLAECSAFITADMTTAINAVDKCAPGLPVEVLAAFADAAYNGGPKIACDVTKSTAARMLKVHNLIGACKQILVWNKAKVAGFFVALPGLTKRRQIESELCLRGTS